ncbi:hypothetical protein NIES22_46600 [Calothrix brevissima NIES-22]|nr:hypothetical protein NIES22_46600 [Calothrix brevissima NIES-22]
MSEISNQFKSAEEGQNLIFPLNYVPNHIKNKSCPEND